MPFDPNASPRDSAEFGIVSARISPETLDKLFRYAHFVNAKQPGLNAKIGTIVRMLLVQALDQAEKEHGPFPAVPKPKSSRK
jgi:hypothetical protein